MLCSDGVWAMIQDDEFAQLITDSDDPENLCRQIVELAMERDSDDNLSIIILYLHRLVPSKAVEKTNPFWPLPDAIRRFFK